MNVTFACKHRAGSANNDISCRERVAKLSFYQGFGRVVQADKDVCLGKSGIVTRSVCADHPILVDLCTGRDCLVEMSPSNRYIVAGSEWRKRSNLPTVRWLQERKIYVLTEIQQTNVDELKARLRRSYYRQDEKTLINPRFVGDLSPAVMAEAGMQYLSGDAVRCYFNYPGRHPKSSIDACGSARACHFAVCARAPCIELKKYHRPVLTSAAGEDITDKIYKMVIPGGVAGHSGSGCNSAIVVTPKGYQLPQLGQQELQRKILLAASHQTRLKVRKQVRAGYHGGAGFDRVIRWVIRTEHFDPCLTTVGKKIDRFTYCLGQFAESVITYKDRQKLKSDITELVDLMALTTVEEEVATVIGQMAVFEQICVSTRDLRHLPKSVCIAGVLAMLRETKDGLDTLYRQYSDRYFANDIFHQIADTGDVAGLFKKYRRHICGTITADKVELITARNELRVSLVALHAKIKELLRVYLEACNVPVDVGLIREVLTSPILLAQDF